MASNNDISLISSVSAASDMSTPRRQNKKVKIIN
jgi:hypothetical protein